MQRSPFLLQLFDGLLHIFSRQRIELIQKRAEAIDSLLKLLALFTHRLTAWIGRERAARSQSSKGAKDGSDDRYNAIIYVRFRTLNYL